MYPVARIRRGWPVVWVRLDDRFPEHPKVAALSPEAFRAHVEALCYAGRNETDGFIPAAIARRLGAEEELVGAGLWEEADAGYRIHGFLDYNPSAASLRQQREQAAERMRRVRANKGRTSQEPVSTPSPSPSPLPVPEPGGVSVSSTTKPRRSDERRAELTAAIDDVLAHHRSHHERFRGGDKERRLIAARLKEGWTVDDLKAAIDGNHRSPFHCGENDRGLKYHKLDLILRDSTHVQQFLDVPENGRLIPSRRLAEDMRAGQNWLRIKEAADGQP